MFLLNLLLAIVWVALTGLYEAGNFAMGFILAFLVLRLTQHSAAAVRYGVRVRLLIFFIGYFLRELVVSSLRVVVLVLSRRPAMQPAIIAIPLDVKSDAAITLLGNLITLTPGTLTLDVSTDHSTMYVHAIDVRDVEAFRAGIKNGFERRILELSI
ncbi:Na+/H+ antiporter subunit E [Candidatus Leptofilum sp.]|uniref:Na+/H+ antiporter subunit E n=1 Tax=Candidatus Leptofilum sp. TaxID=3241576 RepID=UPI003B5B4CB9